MPLDGRRRFQGIIQREDARGAVIELEDGTELVAHIHEMSKASLVLTDALIEDATQAGSLPPQPGDEDFLAFEADTDLDEDTEETMEERISPS